MLYKLLLIYCFLPIPVAQSFLYGTIAKNRTYDYIIVGGGTSGLVVANRLTELEKRTVLIIENGYIDDHPSTKVPYLANSLNTALIYNITSAPAFELANLTDSVLSGNVVGGGSVVNGMTLARASAADYDAWEHLGNPGWNKSSLNPYFQKFSTFTPPSATLTHEYNMTWDANAYGNGPIQVSFPPFQWPDIKGILNALRASGIRQSKKSAVADAVGLYWAPYSLDPKTETRSHAKTSYYDTVKSRTNLALLTGSKVSKIIFANTTAVGVESISRSDNDTTTFFARQEVILAAGAIHTPHLLQLSGLGPKDILEAANVTVKKEFPGVGANFQDHPVGFTVWDANFSFPNPSSMTSNSTYNASAWQEYVNNKSGPYTYAHGTNIISLPFQDITSNYDTVVAQYESQNVADFLPSIYTSSKSLLDGYNKQREVISELLLSNYSAMSEYPIGLGTVMANVLQRPVSRGTVTINPNDKHGEPIVQYNTLQNPMDKAMLAAMIRWSRAQWTSPSLSRFNYTELLPGADATSDETIINTLVSNALLRPSFSHPCGTSSMMPENLGGVVGPDLQVYGTQHLSVVDASIIPLIPAAHLQATVYAVAEKAADIIKARN